MHFQVVWNRIKFFSLVSLCRQEPAAYEVVKMVMALPHLPARRGPPNQMEVTQHSFADGLVVIENRIRNEMLDERLLQLTDYVRNFWMAKVGTATLSAFKMVRRTNNSCESFHSKLLLALGRQKNVWTFVTKTIPKKQFIFLRACCGEKCYKGFSRCEQQNLFDSFYNLPSKECQDIYLSGCLTLKGEVKRRVVEPKLKKENFWEFYLKQNACPVKVCLSVFCFHDIAWIYTI
ncbi:hypothetical protein LSTR_LSTR011304 [Laodelphax striatellus]|uniref:Uncharacterized protein n=1 Tax=Laodelphax striatellus TaxID=195883 RepID=A0A482WG63_LAOST|nr:hypothetical protein LSTR_LSTR011304 [Laodelphax striatellus]